MCCRNIDAAVAKPFVMAYLAAIGLYLLFRAWRGTVEPRDAQDHRAARPGRRLPRRGGRRRLGAGGDVSNLLVQGATPRETIGTVNTAEFFLTATISATFIAQLGLAAFTLQTLGILIGGLIAAPLGGVLAKRVPRAAADGDGRRAADADQRLLDLRRAREVNPTRSQHD